MQLWRIALRESDAERWLASKIIIAVPGLSDQAGTTDDDVRLEGVAGTVDGIGDVAGPFSGFWVTGRGSVRVVKCVEVRRGRMRSRMSRMKSMSGDILIRSGGTGERRSGRDEDGGGELHCCW